MRKPNKNHNVEESIDILKSFINAVLGDADFPEIKSVAVTNPFNVKTYIDEKFSVIDTRTESLLLGKDLLRPAKRW